MSTVRITKHNGPNAVSNESTELVRCRHCGGFIMWNRMKAVSSEDGDPAATTVQEAQSYGLEVEVRDCPECGNRDMYEKAAAA